MILEEALKLLREGRKITHPSFDEDVYLMGCYVSLKFTDEPFEDSKNRGMSVVKMKGNKQHQDMAVEFPPPCFSPLHLCPQLNLFLLMADNWEIYEK